MYNAPTASCKSSAEITLDRDFPKLSAAADTRKARGDSPRYIEPSRWRQLSDAIPDNWDEMTIEGLTAHFDRVRRRYNAAVSTVEALMLALRERGVKALAEPTVQRRLTELSDQQVIDVGNRLQRLKPIAWTTAEVALLFQERLK